MLIDELSISQSHRSANKPLSDADRARQIRLRLLSIGKIARKKRDRLATEPRQRRVIVERSSRASGSFLFLAARSFAKASEPCLPKVRFFPSHCTRVPIYCHVIKINPARLLYVRTRMRANQMNQRGTLDMTHATPSTPLLASGFPSHSLPGIGGWQTTIRGFRSVNEPPLSEQIGGKRASSADDHSQSSWSPRLQVRKSPPIESRDDSFRRQRIISSRA